MFVAAFTASRADYGLLYPLLEHIAEQQRDDLIVLAAGTHNSPEYGSTADLISGHGFDVVSVPSISQTDDRLGAIASHAAVMQAVGMFLSLHQPDVLLLLGDRFETHAAATAAYMMGVSIVHLHGGEVIHGVFDDGLRHAISKMASVHLVVRAEFRDRLVRMGEDPRCVHVVGAIGNFDVRSEPDDSVWEEMQELYPDLREDGVVVCVHPETADLGADVARPVARAMHAMDEHFIVIDTNVDPGGRAVRNILWDAVHTHPRAQDHVHVTGLMRDHFLELLRRSRLLLGNSSAGLIEAPLIGIPVIDVGTRQEGRPRSMNVIHAPAVASEVISTYHQVGAHYNLFAAWKGHGVTTPAYPPGDPARVWELVEMQLDLMRRPKMFYDSSDEV